MGAKMVQKTIREVAGIFLDKDKLQGAIDELLIHEFDRRHISVIGNEKQQPLIVHPRESARERRAFAPYP